MSIQKGSGIYNYTIYTRNDLNHLLDHCTAEEKGAIDKILLDRYPSYSSIENLHRDELNRYVQTIYWGTLGFTSSNIALPIIKKYKDLLKASATCCDAVIIPQLIRSLKCHQNAMNDYLKAKQATIPTLSILARKAALLKMKTVQQLARGISKNYEHLRTDLEPIRDELRTLSNSLVNDIKAIGDRSANDPAEPKERKLERLAILNLTRKSLTEAFQRLNDLVNYNFQKRKLCVDAQCHCLKLSNSKLADEKKVEAIETGELENKTAQDTSVLIAEVHRARLERKAFEAQAFAITGGNFPLFMQTGREISPILPPPPVTGIQKEFEESYLNWLTLVKVNQTLTRSLAKAAQELEKIESMISEVEQDPLAIALRQNPRI